MEKLDFKHIAPYLDTDNFMYLGLNGKKGYFTPSLFNDGWELLFDVKPILRPLSDLRKDEYFEMYLDLCDELKVFVSDFLLEALLKGNYYAMDIQKHPILDEWMFKNHFDWKFGLIEKGLAIDINLLKYVLDKEKD